MTRQSATYLLDQRASPLRLAPIRSPNARANEKKTLLKQSSGKKSAFAENLP